MIQTPGSPSLNRRVLLSGMAGVVVSVPVAARARQAAPTPDALLDAAFAVSAPPALIGGVITREGLVWSGVRGVRRSGGIEAATIDDRWHLGSNTKAMTAALYGRLVDKGQARWGATMGELFPGMTIDPAWATTPLESFLNHTAGLRDADMLGSTWLLTARADPASLTRQRSVLAERALAKPPGGPVGAFAYANANYILVGAAIERITGLSWEDAMAAEVFQPLNLTTGGSGPPLGDQPWGHSGLGGQATPMDPTNLFSDNPLAMGPAGTAHLSLRDYATFVRAFLTDGGGWLKPETIAHLITPPVATGRSYALGWITLAGQPWARGTVIAHEGTNTMWHSMVVADPVGGRAYIALSNEEVRGGPACQQLVSGLIRMG